MEERGPVELTWEGGEHKFYLGIRELRALQEKCDAGPPWIARRLLSDQWLVDDIVETVRLGLKGGGLDGAEANKLIRKFVEPYPLTESLPLAVAVLQSALFSVEDDPVGEFEPQAATESQQKIDPSQGEKSDSPEFTDF